MIIAALAFAAVSNAEVYTYQITLTNTQPITYSDPLPVSGWLDKIEVLTDAASTTTVTVATYGGSAGTTAIDTFATKAITAGGTAVVFRPRVIGTTTAGVNLAGATTAGTGGLTNSITATQALIAKYEKVMVGGNIKVATTGTANDGACPVTVSIFYQPVKH